MTAAITRLALLLTTMACLLSCEYNPHNTPDEVQNIKLVKEMYIEMAEKVDASFIDQFYSKDFIIESNTAKMNLAQFKKYHEDAFRKRRSLTVKQPFDDLFAKDEKVVGRTKMTVEDLNGKKQTYDVIFIALVDDNRIKRLWEVTYPGK